MRHSNQEPIVYLGSERRAAYFSARSMSGQIHPTSCCVHSSWKLKGALIINDEYPNNWAHFRLTALKTEPVRRISIQTINTILYPSNSNTILTIMLSAGTIRPHLLFHPST